VKESFAIRDQELQIANLRPVNGRVVDLRDNAVPNREPEMAGCGVCRAGTVFVAVRPARLDAWFSKRFRSSNSLHSRTSSSTSLRDSTRQKWLLLL
jgi:hypothetical protein